MGGAGHEDYYPRLCDCSRRRCDDRFWALGALHSDQGKGRSEALHTDDPNNSCRSCPDWPCPDFAPAARVGDPLASTPVNDLRHGLEGTFAEGHELDGKTVGDHCQRSAKLTILCRSTLKIICFPPGSSTTNFNSSPGGCTSLMVISPLIWAISPLTRSPPMKLKPSK